MHTIQNLWATNHGTLVLFTINKEGLSDETSARTNPNAKRTNTYGAENRPIALARMNESVDLEIGL